MSKARNALDKHCDSVWYVDEVENNHEDEGSKLKVMSLPSQSSWSINVIVLDNIYNNRYKNNVNHLGNIAFVHDRDDIYCFAIVLFDENHIQQNIPNQPIEYVNQDYAYNRKPLLFGIAVSKILY